MIYFTIQAGTTEIHKSSLSEALDAMRYLVPQRRARVDLQVRWDLGNNEISIPPKLGQLTWNQVYCVLKLFENDIEAITLKNVPGICQVAHSVGNDFSFRELDNALYRAGHLPPLQPHLRALDGNIESPSSAEASMLHEALLEIARARDSRMVATSLQNGHISQRAHDVELAEINAKSSAEWANRVVNALKERDIPVLLSVFASKYRREDEKKFAHAQFGLDLSVSNDARRRDAIFRFCGVDESGQTAWMQCATEQRSEQNAARRLAQEQEQQRLERQRNEERVARILETAGQRTTRNPFGAVQPWSKVIDELIAAGYTEIVSQSDGGSPHVALLNTETRYQFPLLKSDWSLGYARLALERVALQIDVLETSYDQERGDSEDEAPRGRESQRG